MSTIWRAQSKLLENELKIVDINLIAKVAHEVNRAYCVAFGDNSQVDWRDAPAWQRSSALNGVQFYIDNPDVRPDQSHNSWLAEKEADGWVFGPVKDAEKKQHPCLVPYNELPADQKAKDYLFIAVVRSMAIE
jgi:hypothetical protein